MHHHRVTSVRFIFIEYTANLFSKIQLTLTEKQWQTEHTHTEILSTRDKMYVNTAQNNIATHSLVRLPNSQAKLLILKQKHFFSHILLTQTDSISWKTNWEANQWSDDLTVIYKQAVFNTKRLPKYRMHERAWVNLLDKHTLQSIMKTQFTIKHKTNE